MSPAVRTLLVVSTATFMATLDLFIVNVAFPDVQAEWPGASVASISWVLNAYAIVLAALLVPAGRLADRFGRRRAFVAGLAVFTLASAACAAAGSVEALVAARVVQAAGAAIVLPTALALLVAALPAERRAAAIGVWAAIGGVAAASGPPLGGLLVELSWRWVFLVNLPVGALAIVAGLRVLRESRDEDARQLPDLAGSALLAAAIGALALGLVQAPEWGWGDARVVAAFAIALVGAIAFARRSARHPSPVVDLDMLRVRSFALANLTLLLFFASFGAMLLGAVLFLTGVWGDSVLRAGLSIAPGPLAAATFAAATGRVAERAGERWLAAAGGALFALGAGWWTWRLGAEHAYAADLLPGLLLTGAGVGLVLSSTSGAAVASLPPARLATGAAVISMSRQIGAVLGVAAWIAIIGEPAPGQAVDAFTDGWAFMALAAAAAAVAALAIGPVARSAPVPAPGARPVAAAGADA